jgi:predicted NBD/HSP70 family sugar kinase
VRRKGPLYALVRSHLGLDVDLDLCARIYGVAANTRAAFAQFAPLVHAAAVAGDTQAIEIFRRAADELTQTVAAVQRALGRAGWCRDSRLVVRRRICWLCAARDLVSRVARGIAARLPLQRTALSTDDRRRAVCRAALRASVDGGGAGDPG